VCVFLIVCVCVCVCVCVRVWTCKSITRMTAHIYVYMYIHMQIYIYTHIHMYFVYIYMYTIDTHMRMYMHIYICMIYIYIHLYTNVFVHIHMHLYSCLPPTAWIQWAVSLLQTIKHQVSFEKDTHVYRGIFKKQPHIESPPKNGLIALWPSTNGSIPDFKYCPVVNRQLLRLLSTYILVY